MNRNINNISGLYPLSKELINALALLQSFRFNIRHPFIYLDSNSIVFGTEEGLFSLDLQAKVEGIRLNLLINCWRCLSFDILCCRFYIFNDHITENKFILLL